MQSVPQSIYASISCVGNTSFPEASGFPGSFLVVFRNGDGWFIYNLTRNLAAP